MATPARPPVSAAPFGPARGGSAREKAESDPAHDITVIPRAVISAAFGVVRTVERAVGVRPIRTARDNAWEAVCADRALAQKRDEIRRTAAALSHSAVGSSPRSKATQV